MEQLQLHTILDYGSDVAVFSLSCQLNVNHLFEGSTILISLDLLPTFGLRTALVAFPKSPSSFTRIITVPSTDLFCALEARLSQQGLTLSEKHL